ncbi:hypothetical protein V2T44_19640 [Serratia ficaria]|jgi:hypothetical protein|nr:MULTISPECIES: hypothetical protein [Serratia]MEE4485154.1 hypothetical protein [Serratia ficaria]CAI0957550.1 Uncharacterised protein [Serratia ficaria]CAI0990091.1 Uncharacterised protein [Serratia ficaria]CAI1158893.1 Uncharacterised protein [Serratia ficaria]CAI1186094.1 Uncharacterised protein [Serratia ficaria]
MPAPFLFVAVTFRRGERMMAPEIDGDNDNKKPGSLRNPAQKWVKQIGAKGSNPVLLAG